MASLNTESGSKQAKVNTERVAHSSSDKSDKPEYCLSFCTGLLILLTNTVTVVFLWLYLFDKFSAVPNGFQLQARNESFTEKTDTKLDESLLPPIIQLNDSVALQMAEVNFNVAATFWDRWKMLNEEGLPASNVTYCANVELTSPLWVHHHNLYWQKMTTTSESNAVYLYNAYYDDRIPKAPMVKILIVNRNESGEKIAGKFGCLLWFEGIRSPALVEAVSMSDLWSPMWNLQQDDYKSQLITCPVPQDHHHDVPQAVSVQQNNGDCSQVETIPRNVLRVIQSFKPSLPPIKRSIGICVKALRLVTRQASVRLVEWLEMVRLMGANKVYLYVYAMSESVRQVLEHYQTDGLVEWRPLTLCGTQPNIGPLYERYIRQLSERFWSQEAIEVNDCLYRNLYQHDYLTVLNVEEMILPRRHLDWQRLIEEFEASLTSTQRKQAYFGMYHAKVCPEQVELEYVSESKFGSTFSLSESIPGQLYMMQHITRGEVQSSESGNLKSAFFRPALVHALHNSLIHCLNSTHLGVCSGVELDAKVTLLFQYGNIPDNDKSCSIRDHTAWKHYHQLAGNVAHHLENIF